MRHLGGTLRSDQELADGLDADIAAFADGSWQRWTVLTKADGEPIGRVGLFTVRAAAAPDSLRGQREVGWMMGEAWQNQGFACEAAKAVIGHAFDQGGLDEIFAQTSDSNVASTRMMARLGLHRRAELDYTDSDYPVADNPTTVYSLTSEQWRSRG